MDDTDRECFVKEEVLKLSDLGAGYGSRRIIDGVGLAIRRGDILGLLGANGSGKSTLIKSITAQLSPKTGTVVIDGIDLARSPERAKARFGLAIDVADLPMSLTGRQYLELVASLRSCASTDWPDPDLLTRLGVTAWLDRPIGECSLGTRAKITIAAALLGSPPLLIFDESLNGLDPVAAWEVKSLLMELAEGGKHSVILSTHAVETIPAFCNRAVFLAEGKIAQSWNQDELAEAQRAPGGFEACLVRLLTNQKRSQAEQPTRT
jgi:ABC-2 type transport system ATP-binding protein